MSKHKINTNRPPLSSAEIAAYRDFEAVKVQFDQVADPLYRTFKFWGSAMVVAAAAGVIGYLALTQSPEISPDSVVKPAEQAVIALEEDPFIQAPVPGYDIPYTIFKVDAEKGGSFQYETGTEINIPPMACIDSLGNPVSGEVEIRYREFHNPLEFFLAGVPMHYDSAGTQYTFESAGMMEMLAFKDGYPVRLDTGKTVDVWLRSATDDPDHNLYYLDTVAGNWVYQGKDRIITKGFPEPFPPAGIDEMAADTGIGIKHGQAMGEDLATPPRQADPSRYQFTIGYDVNAFPELALYDQLQFEVSDKNDHFDPKFYEVTWDDAVIRQSEASGEYVLTLSIGDTAIQLIVYPVISAQDYPQAMQKFQAAYQSYQQQYDQRKQQVGEPALKKRSRAERAAYNEKWLSRQNNFLQGEAMKLHAQSTQQVILRNFAMNSFGVWNCDQPRMRPKGVQLLADYKNRNEDPITMKNIYVVDSRRNMLYTYYPGQKVRFDLKAKNVLWGITEHKLIAIFRPEEFKKIKKTSGKYTFQMEVMEDVVAINELKSIINL